MSAGRRGRTRRPCSECVGWAKARSAVPTRSNGWPLRRGHAEPVIGPAEARPVGFAHPAAPSQALEDEVWKGAVMRRCAEDEPALEMGRGRRSPCAPAGRRHALRVARRHRVQAGRNLQLHPDQEFPRRCCRSRFVPLARHADQQGVRQSGDEPVGLLWPRRRFRGRDAARARPRRAGLQRSGAAAARRLRRGARSRDANGNGGYGRWRSPPSIRLPSSSSARSGRRAFCRC